MGKKILVCMNPCSSSTCSSRVTVLSWLESSDSDSYHFISLSNPQFIKLMATHVH